MHSSQAALCHLTGIERVITQHSDFQHQALRVFSKGPGMSSSTNSSGRMCLSQRIRGTMLAGQSPKDEHSTVHVDTTPTCTRTDAHVSRAHMCTCWLCSPGFTLNCRSLFWRRIFQVSDLSACPHSLCHSFFVRRCQRFNSLEVVAITKFVVGFLPRAHFSIFSQKCICFFIVQSGTLGTFFFEKLHCFRHALLVTTFGMEK